MISRSAEDYIRELGLARHPEGGWFRETYRSTEQISGEALPARFNGDRSFCTAIYFLLQEGDVSAFHRIKSDELWHFHTGAPLTIHILSSDDGYRCLSLGTDAGAGELFQAVVPAGCWFGAEITGKEGFALVSCTVAPGFDFADFEMGKRETLKSLFPNHGELIGRLSAAQSIRWR